MSHRKQFVFPVKLTNNSWMFLFETIGIFIADEDEAKSGGGGNIEQAERERVAIANTNAEADNRKSKKEERVAERDRPSAKIEADIEKAKQERMKLVKIEEDRLAKEQEKRIAREQQAEVVMASNYNSSAKSYSLSLKDYTSLVVNVDTLLRDHRSLNSWLDSLAKIVNILVNKSEECPRLIWFYLKDPSCKDWLNDPMKFLLSDRLMLVFVCPVTFKIVKCGPNGDGWEVRNPKGWVEKWGPAIVVSLKVLNFAMKAGRVLSLPLPNIALDEVIDDKLICNSLNKLAGAFTSTLKDSVNGDVESSIVPEDIERLSGDACIEINTFLTSGENTSLPPPAFAARPSHDSVQGR